MDVLSLHLRQMIALLCPRADSSNFLTGSIFCTQTVLPSGGSFKIVLAFLPNVFIYLSVVHAFRKKTKFSCGLYRNTYFCGVILSSVSGYTLINLTLSTLRLISFCFCLDLKQTRGYLCYITVTGTNSVPKIKSYAWMCVYLTRVYSQVPWPGLQLFWMESHDQMLNFFGLKMRTFLQFFYFKNFCLHDYTLR